MPATYWRSLVLRRKDRLGTPPTTRRLTLKDEGCLAVLSTTSPDQPAENLTKNGTGYR